MTERLESIEYQNDNTRTVVHGTWYRGETCNYQMAKKHREDPLYYDKYVLDGWMPEQPIITKKDVVTSFGSCFAAHITHYLKEQGYNVGNLDAKHGQSHVIRFGEGIVNVHAILQQLQWGLSNRAFKEDLWYGSKGELAQATKEIQITTKELFKKTNVWIITLGLSEVWYNKKTNEVFWRAIPRSVFNPDIHGFKVLSFEETYKVLESICSTIREVQPFAPIIFTLSPIPLITTFRPVSCITANSVSKALLRAAIDTLMRNYTEDTNLYYFPAYEIVHATHDPFEEDNRHPKRIVIETIMQLFKKYFCKET